MEMLALTEQAEFSPDTLGDKRAERTPRETDTEISNAPWYPFPLTRSYNRTRYTCTGKRQWVMS